MEVSLKMRTLNLYTVSSLKSAVIMYSPLLKQPLTQ